MKTKSTALARQRETKYHEMKESRHRPWVIFLVFCGWYNVLVRWFRLYSCASRVRPLFEARPKLGPQLSGVFTLSYFVFFWPLHHCVSLSSNSFSVFYPASIALWRFHLSFLQSIKTRCRFAADTFLFLSRASLIILLFTLKLSSC